VNTRQNEDRCFFLRCYRNPNGINDLGEIVGRHDDTAGHTHGFYAVKQ